MLLVSLILIGVGIGLAWGHIAVFGADQIQDPTHIAVYFHGYYFSYQLGVALTLYTVTENTTSDYEVLVLMGLFGCCFSFVMFLSGTPFYLPEFKDHLKDPFILLCRNLLFNRKRRQSNMSGDSDGKLFSDHVIYFPPSTPCWVFSPNTKAHFVLE